MRRPAGQPDQDHASRSRRWLPRRHGLGPEEVGERHAEQAGAADAQEIAAIELAVVFATLIHDRILVMADK